MGETDAMPAVLRILLVDDHQLVWVSICNQVRRVGGQHHIGPGSAKEPEQLPLKIGMQVDLRLIDHDQLCRCRPNKVSEQLAPDLETDAHPEYFAGDLSLGAEHMQATACIREDEFGWSHGNVRPRRSEKPRELAKVAGEVPPEVSEVS